MKILLDSVIYGLQRFGGISAYWNELSTRLLDSAEVSLSHRMPSSLRATVPAVSANATTHRDRAPVSMARYLPIFEAESFDIIHSSYYRVPIADSILVTTVYDFTYENYRNGLAKWIHSAQKRIALARSNGLIFISESTRADAIRLYPQVSRTTSVVIPLASNPSVFYPDHRPRASLPLNLQEARYALFVGQRPGYKRFDLAVAAVSAVRHLWLVLVGPPLSPEETAFLDMSLGCRWQAFHCASNDDLRLLYSHAECFVYPSDYEGFGLPILDSMACGCPVVCANRSSFPEVAGAAAILVVGQDPKFYARAIEESMRQKTRDDLRARGLLQARSFSWEKTVDETVEFYKELDCGR